MTSYSLLSLFTSGVFLFLYTLLKCVVEYLTYIWLTYIYPEVSNTEPGHVGGFLIIILSITALLSVAANLTGDKLCFYPIRCYWAWLMGHTIDAPACTGQRNGPSILDGSVWKMTRAPRCVNR